MGGFANTQVPCMGWIFLGGEGKTGKGGRGEPRSFGGWCFFKLVLGGMWGADRMDDDLEMVLSPCAWRLSYIASVTNMFDQRDARRCLHD